MDKPCSPVSFPSNHQDPYWSIGIVIPSTIGQTNSFQLQLAWRPSGWFMALFSFPCVLPHINHPHAGLCDPHFIYLPRQLPCRAFLDPFLSFPPLTPVLLPSDRREQWVSLTRTWHRPGNRAALNSVPGRWVGTHLSWVMSRCSLGKMYKTFYFLSKWAHCNMIRFSWIWSWAMQILQSVSSLCSTHTGCTPT